MRFTIKCDACGHKHKLERKVYFPGLIYIVCHNCETSLEVTVNPKDVRPAQVLWGDLVA